MDSDNKKRMSKLLMDKLGIQLIVSAPFIHYEGFDDANSVIFVQTKGNSRYTYCFTYEELGKKIKNGLTEELS